MKHAITLSILLTLFGCHSAKQNISVNPQPEEPAPALHTVNTNLPGGFSQAAVNDESVVSAAEFAVAEQGKTQPNTQLKLEKIISAQQQVVAGMNYNLTLSVSIDGKTKEAEAVVWWQAWRNPNPYMLTSWEWK
ncbi:MAG: hypothetical protein JXR23_04700 [Pontiellaceae bacterium]|nr:hypothetical protein [Pontiellaceae bacterium]